RAGHRLSGQRAERSRQHGQAVPRVRRAVRVLPRAGRRRAQRLGRAGRGAYMALEHVGYVELPDHIGTGGFDHAAVHERRGLCYVAHTANDAVDVIDCAAGTYLRSIPGLPRVAGALVSEAHDLVFTSNRAESTVGIFSPAREDAVAKVKVGI